MAVPGQTSERAARARPVMDGRNVGDWERLASLIGGGALAVVGLRRRGWRGWAMAAWGGALVYRGASGHCPVYERLGIDRQPEVASTGQEAPTAARPVTTMNVNKPAGMLYRYWRDFANLPAFMANLASVTVGDDRLSHWVAKARFGPSVAWDTEIVEDVPNERIVWHSLPGAEVVHAGEVTFRPATGGRGTDVQVRIAYQPPGGRLAVGLARLFGEAPDQRVREDVRRFKQLMEAGEIISNAGPTCR
jgi:uncharacterized membrane protein